MHRTFTCLAATFLFILVVFLLWVRTSPSNTSTGSGTGVDGLFKPRAQTQDSTQAARSSTATRPQLATGPNSSLSSPFWRPSAVFGKTMMPVPVREFPRGEHFTRRYHESVSREVDPALSSQAPSVLAGSPEDGRYHLLPEEMDEHTLQAGRMVFDPSALDQVVAGQTSRILAPTLTEEVLALEFKTVKTRSANTHTLQGHVVGEETTSTAQIVYHDGILHGTVVRYDKNEELEYRILADGHMMMRQLDHSTMTGGCSTCSGEIMADVVDESSIGGDEKYNFGSDPEDPISYDNSGWRTIDVTVGYTVEARVADGGNSQIEARIIASVDRMTLAFANSAIANTELILLGTIEDPDFVEDSSTKVFDAHTKLRNLTDGFLDVVSDFHQQLGSDLASIIVSSTQTGGVAGVAVSGSWSSANARSQMTSSQMTFEHELGHNLGCAHAWGDTSEGNTESNMGWRFQGTSGTKYTTIMAYAHVSSWGARIPYFSNPNVIHPDGNVPTGCVDGYDATNDSTVDPALKLGYDGSVLTRGANNASTIDTGEGNPSYGATVASDRATRTDFEVLTPAAAAQWEKGTTRTISFSGGDMDDLATIQLYKGGVLHTTLASGVNPVNHRNFAWEIPFSLTDGADYMIRVELSRNGSTLFADSGIFETFSDLPHVNIASAPAVPAVIGQISSLILTFNVPMNPATFDAGTDIVSFLNPEGGSILGTITGTTWSAGNTVLAIQFTPPSLQGSCQMTIGPDIEDMAGNKMDQDGDGTTGESVQDRFTVTFHVNPPLIRYDNMDADPGWTYSANNPVAGWAWGQPTGGTGYGPYGIPDPTSGYNGANVIGYNLTGDYERGITETRWATTPSMDCSDYKNVRLRFQRWLGVYNGHTYGDHAYIEVSNDGSNWVPVWHNTNLSVNVASWVEVEYDISSVADGQSTVYVRWGMGKTNSSLNDDSCGWNIDEVIVHGDYVDSSDITPPFPSTMTFASAPTAQGVSAITMTATTALDANGVEYFFDETSGNPGGADSGWQDSPTYTDTGLQAGTQYTYTVKARDKSPGQNETVASTPASATTDAGPTLTLTISAASIGESDGPGATTATVTRNTDTGSPLLVNLSSNDSTEATVPSTVTIAAGQNTSPPFHVNAVDDAILDGTQSVTLTATATGHTNGNDTIDVTDDVPLTLTVVIGTNGESSSGGGLKDPDGSPFAITATPATGYGFGQWTVISGDVSFDNENSASTTVGTAGDATVQANFVVGSFTVTYAGNGSDGGAVPTDVSSPYDYNSMVTVLGNTGALTRTGHSFSGWNTAGNGSGTGYVGGNTFSIAGDTTLYAQWTPETYTISYHGNGSTGGTVPDSQTKTYSEALTLATNSGELVKDGFTFDGWNTAEDGSGIDYPENGTFTTDLDTTLFAKWNSPPGVTSYSPAHTATDVNRASDLVITFNEDIAFGTGNITLRQSGGALVETFDVGIPSPGLSLSGSTVTLNPSANLALATTYYVEIDTTAIDDLTGNSFAGFNGNGTWSFTTSNIGTTAAIILVGTQYNLESKNDDPAVGWRRPATAKTLDIDGDNVFGTDGYRTSNRGSNPAYLNSTVVAPNMNNFSRIDDPNSTTADVQTGTLHDGAAGLGVETSALLQFVITGAVPVGETLRVGILIDGVGSALGTNSATYTLKQTVGGSATATTPALFYQDGGLDVTCFDLTGLNEGDTFVVTSTTTATSEWPGAFEQVIGITFDTGVITPPANTFTNWISGFTGLGGLTAFDDDADGDGIPNGIENYFGSHPGEASLGIVAQTVSDNVFTFTHPLNDSPASNISATYRWSKDLSNFHVDGDAFEGTTVDFSQSAPTEGMVTVTATITGTPVVRLFVDVAVIQN